MLSTTFFWFIWLFVFIPVLAWILGIILPTKSKDSPTPNTPSKDGDSATGKPAAPSVATVVPAPHESGATTTPQS